MRTLGTALCTLPIASVLLEQSAPGWVWALLALNALLWPHFALWMGRRSKEPVATEHRSLMMDSAFGGAWVAAMGVSAGPAAVFATLLTADKVAAGGWRLMLRATVTLLAGFGMAWAVLGFPFQPVSSPRTLLACVPFMFIYTVTLCTLTYELREQVVKKNRELKRLTRMDPVMQVANRPHFETVAALELSRFHRSGRRAALLLIDVDRFKVVNDRHGHGMGDAVLRIVAAILREEVREVDLAARYGGDEFALLLVDRDTTRAVVVAERIRARVAGQRFGDAPLTVSLSIGVAETSHDYATLDTWVQAADTSLYRAKAAGRNQVCITPPPRGPSDAEILAA
jgi:diguanylate cyclase